MNLSNSTLPNGWTKKRLSEIAEVTMGQSPPSSSYNRSGSGLPLIQGNADIVNRRTITRVWTSNPSKTATLGDIIMTVRAPVGAIGVAHSRVCLGRGVCAIRAISVDDAFLRHQLQRMEGDWESLSQGSTFTAANSTQVRGLTISVPSSADEQRAIAAALSDAAAWVESLDALIAKKRDVFEGMCQMLLTGTQRLPGFHENWTESRLGEIGTFVRGSGITKSQVTARGIPCVRYGELYTLHRYFIRKFGSFVPEHVASSATPIRRGDLLIATSGETKEDIGPTAVVDSDEHAVAGGDLVIFRTTKAEPTFLAYLLNSHDVQMQKAKVAKGDAVVHIYTADLSGLLLDLPELAEQCAIARVLADVSTEIDNLVAERDKAELIRHGMAQDLLSGKVRLV